MFLLLKHNKNSVFSCMAILTISSALKEKWTSLCFTIAKCPFPTMLGQNIGPNILKDWFWPKMKICSPIAITKGKVSFFTWCDIRSCARFRHRNKCPAVLQSIPSEFQLFWWSWSYTAVWKSILDENLQPHWDNKRKSVIFHLVWHSLKVAQDFVTEINGPLASQAGSIG